MCKYEGIPENLKHVKKCIFIYNPKITTAIILAYICQASLWGKYSNKKNLTDYRNSFLNPQKKMNIFKTTSVTATTNICIPLWTYTCVYVCNASKTI